MNCTKCVLTNLSNKIVVFNYQECENLMWNYNVELEPNQIKNIWFIEGTYSSASSNLISQDCGTFPPTPSSSPLPPSTPTPTPTPSQTSSTPTPTPTQTTTNTVTPTPSQTPTQTYSETPTQTPTNTETATPTPTPTSSGGEMLINPIITENDEYIQVGIDEYLMF